MRRCAIPLLFLAGWIVPNVEPGYCLTFAASTTIIPHEYQPDYRVFIYLGECGWFSKTIVLEEIQERTHGRSMPRGPWIFGHVLAIGAAVTGIIGNFFPLSKAFFVPLWTVFRPLLVIMAIHALMAVQPIWCMFFLTGIYIVYFFGVYFFQRDFGKLSKSTASRRLIGLSVLFFPLWVLALCIVQETSPYFGCGLTFLGALLLATDRTERYNLGLCKDSCSEV